MKPADDPKVAVIKDGDCWTAIIGDERFERFRSEGDAWGFVRCLCSDDAGEWDKVDLNFADTDVSERGLKCNWRRQPVISIGSRERRERSRSTKNSIVNE